jgi:hypothetical protein
LLGLNKDLRLLFENKRCRNGSKLKDKKPVKINQPCSNFSPILNRTTPAESLSPACYILGLLHLLPPGPSMSVSFLSNPKICSSRSLVLTTLSFCNLQAVCFITKPEFFLHELGSSSKSHHELPDHSNKPAAVCGMEME